MRFSETFRKQSLAERTRLSKKLKHRHSKHLPVIVDCINDEMVLKRNKFHVHKDKKIGEMFQTIRNQLVHRLKPEEAMFFYAKDTVLTPHFTVAEIYRQYKDTDGFLYVYFSKETAFG